MLGAVVIFGIGFITANYFFEIDQALSVGWAVLVAGCFFALLAAVPLKFFNVKTLAALAGLPKGMLLMLLSLLKIRGANKTFIHTKHSANIQAK